MTPAMLRLIQAPSIARQSKAYALTDDENGRFQEAAAGYEAVLESDPEDLESTVNLAVLYWQAAGCRRAPGTRSAQFAAHAGRRLRELLESAGHLFADRAEVRFWRRYIAAADLGCPLEPHECREMLRERPDYLEPAFVVFSNSSGCDAEPEAMRLLARCAEQPTARGRYVSSIINAALRKQRWNNSGSPFV